MPHRAPHAACLPQVGREAHFPVKSTCPCNFTLYYEVAARGNIVLSGQQPAHITQQRSRRAAAETPIRLMHLSETGEPGRRQVFLVLSEPLRPGWVPQKGGVSRTHPGGGACLRTEGLCPRQDVTRTRRWAVSSCWRWRGPLQAVLTACLQGTRGRPATGWTPVLAHTVLCCHQPVASLTLPRSPSQPGVFFLLSLLDSMCFS